MKKIVLLTGDTRAAKEIGTWLKELSGETVLEVHSDVAKFHRRYRAKGDEIDAEASEAKSADDAAVDLEALGANAQRHFAVNLLIIDLEMIERDPMNWILETRNALFQNGFSKEESPTRFLLIGYSDAEFDIDNFRHDAVDDLMLKPLDKDLFLQKTELHLADGQSVQASFLFKQRAELRIEMGKDSWIELISEFGFAIRNPAPLAPGVYARVYSRLFGEGPEAALVGRVYRNDRHPTEAGVYLCYLTFHGISSTQLSHVRKFLRQDKTVVQKPPIPPPGFQAPQKSVVVIDMNADARESIRDSLQNNFANVRVQGFPSYSSFLKFCARRLAGTTEVPGGQPLIEGESPHLTLAGASEISFLVDATAGDLLSMEPNPKSGVTILGAQVDELRDRPTSWLSLFKASDKEEIEEFLVYLRSGQMGQLLVVSEGGSELGPVRLRVKGRLERSPQADSGGIARLTFRELTEEEWKEAVKESHDSAAVEAIDALYVDGSLLGEDPEASLAGLADLLKKTRMIESREALTLTILGDERSKLRPDDFRIKAVQDFLYKPLDRKMMLDKAAISIRGLIAKTDVIDLVYRRAGQKGRITKEVLMEEVSEFGLQIRHETPLKEHTYLRFFSSVFLDEKGDGLLGRCLFSTRDPDSGLYHCFFSFFGVTDAQLKHIRTWIRGDYAAKKEKAGG